MSVTEAVLSQYWKLRKQNSQYAYRQQGAATDLCNAKLLTFIDRNWDKLESEGLVRCRILPDEYADMDDLKGDCYNVKCNASSVPGGERTIKAQEKAFESMVERDGVWGFMIEYRKPACDSCGRKADWEHVDSCWGFAGEVYDEAMRYGKAEAIRKALNT